MSTRKIIKGRERRKKRIRSKIFGTNLRPRVSVFRSNRYISAQVIDDNAEKTLFSVNTKNVEGKNKGEKIKNAGENLAKETLKNGIKKVVFDRGGYLYTGRIKAFAEALRSSGLEF